LRTHSVVDLPQSAQHNVLHLNVAFSDAGFDGPRFQA